MADLQTLNFIPTSWGPELEGWLHKIDGIERHIEALADQVRIGQAQALKIELEGRNVGSLIWSVEVEPRGRVLVVNALAATPIRDLDVAKATVAMVATVGRKAGAVAVRFWTERRGLVRKAEALGFRKTYVMEGLL